MNWKSEIDRLFPFVNLWFEQKALSRKITYVDLINESEQEHADNVVSLLIDWIEIKTDNQKIYILSNGNLLLRKFQLNSFSKIKYILTWLIFDSWKHSSMNII